MLKSRSMKTLAYLPLFFTLIFSPFCSANTLSDPIDESLSEAALLTSEPSTIEGEIIDINQSSTIKQLGRGVEDKKTGKIIHLLCVGKPIEGSTEPSCTTVGFFIWDPTIPSTMTPISGQYFHLQYGDQISPELKSELKSVLTQKIKNQKKRRKTERAKRQNPKRGLAIMCYLMMGSALALGVASAGIMGPGLLLLTQNLGAGIIWGPVGAGVLGSYLLKNGVNSLDIFTGPHHAPVSFMGTISSSQALGDQTGWNWAVEPHRIKHKKFQLLFNALLP